MVYSRVQHLALTSMGFSAQDMGFEILDRGGGLGFWGSKTGITKSNRFLSHTPRGLF